MIRRWFCLAITTTIAAAATVLALAPAAHAESPVALLCRPTSWTGSNWSTYPNGGYCQDEVVYKVTPTGGPNGATATWTFNNLSLNGNYRIDAWIPWYRATARMDWDTEVKNCTILGCEFIFVSLPGFDENIWSSWYPIAWFAKNATGVMVEVKAWSGMVTPNYYLGVDAIRIVYTG
jgi:hypothetical protein